MPGQVQVAGEFQHVDAEAEHVTSLGESPLESLRFKVPDSVIMILFGFTYFEAKYTLNLPP